MRFGDAESKTLMTVLISSFRSNFILWTSCLISLFFLDTPDKKILASISLLLLIILIIMQVNNTQYFMPLMPLIAIMAGYGVSKVSFLFPRNGSFIIWPVVIICILFPSYSYLTAIKVSSKIEKLKKIEYVLSITKPWDIVLDGNIRFNLFRKDLDYIWFSRRDDHMLLWFKGKEFYHYDVFELIDKFKPKVISQYRIRNMNDQKIMNNYRRSTVYSDLFIRIN